jgi:3-hydroxyacyl-[acyl-carrier-protein] dehydratase
MPRLRHHNLDVMPSTLDSKFDSGTGEVLDSEAIHSLLGHRHPFLLVERITIVEPAHRVVGTKRISSGEWWCEGHDAGSIHFPFGLVIEAMAQTTGALIRGLVGGAGAGIAYFMGVNHVRLRTFARPGDELTMTLTLKQWRRGICRTRGVATVDDRLVASADLTTVVRTVKDSVDRS